MMFDTGSAAQDRRLNLAFWGVALLIGLTAGVASATANLFVLVLVVGGLGGIVMLAFPHMTIWIVLIGAFIVAGLVQLFLPELQRIAWLVSILGFVLLGSVLLNALRPAAIHWHAPAFVWIAAAIFIYGVVVSLLQGSPALELLAGIRRYFPMWGLIFALAFLKWSPRIVLGWTKLFVAVAIVQLPFVLYQVVVLVPHRRAIASSFENINSSIVPIDVVAGTFGASLAGGGANNLLAAFLVIVIAILTALWQERGLTTKAWLALTAPCVLPLFLGEVKITVLYLLILLLMLGFRRTSEGGWRQFGLLLGGGVLVSGLAVVILVFYSKGMSASEFLENTLAYNFGEKGHGGNELNRLTALLFWLDQHGWHNAMETLFGHGLGSSFSGSGGLIAGRLEAQYASMGVGLTAASQLLWDMGLVGAILLAAMFVSAWRAATLVGRQTDRPEVRAGMTAARIALVILAVWYPYKATILTNPAAQVLFASVFGYIAYSWQTVRLEAAAQSRVTAP